MKIYLALVVIGVIIFEIVYYRPGSVYNHGRGSDFPHRIVNFIDHELQKNCKLDKKFDFLLNEKVQTHKKSFEYSLTFLRGQNMEVGELHVDEYHTGEIKLSYLKCPEVSGRTIGSLSRVPD